MKNKQTKVSPTGFVRPFEDYHYIDFVRDTLGEGWTCEEVASGPDLEGFETCYWGLFWQGKRPSQKKVLELLKQEGLDVDEKDEDGDLVAEVY